jgi:hypothetical protein
MIVFMNSIGEGVQLVFPTSGAINKIYYRQWAAAEWFAWKTITADA